MGFPRLIQAREVAKCEARRLSSSKSRLFFETHDTLIEATNRLLQRGHGPHERPERDAHVVEIRPHKIEQIGYRLESSIDPLLESAGTLLEATEPALLPKELLLRQSGEFF